MKKKLALILITGAVMASLSACGQKTENKDIEVSATQQETGEAATESEAENKNTNNIPNYVALEDLNVDEYIVLADYKNVTVNVDKTEVLDADIKTYINSSILRSYPITDRAVANGDLVTIDFVGKKDGVAFDGGTSEGYQLGIGSGSFIPGFEEGLIGVMPGETKDLELTFPEDYHAEDLAGVQVVFTVTVHNILVEADFDTVTPEQLALMELEYDSKDDIWEAAKAELAEDAEKNYRYNIESEILKNLLENSTFNSIPEPLVQEEIQNYNKYVETLAQMYYNIDLETFVTSQGQTMDEYTEAITKTSQETVKEYLVYETVARAEGLSVTEDEIRKAAQEEADRYGYESAQAVIDEVGAPVIRLRLLSEKVMEKLSGYAKVEPVTQSE